MEISPVGVRKPDHSARRVYERETRAGRGEEPPQRIGLLGWLVHLPLLLGIAAAHLLSYKLVSLRKPQSERMDLVGLYLAQFLIRMGPLYIKLGQILATRSDLLPEVVIARLRRLHDDCPPSSEGYIRRLLEQAYGRRVDEVFAEFDFNPVASGSIAQVHRAVLFTGAVIAVKIVKRGVRVQLARDLRLVGLALSAKSRMRGFVRDHRLAEYFAEIYGMLAAQADMIEEQTNQQDIYERMSGHPFIIVPKPYRELSNRDILVMEFKEGIRGKDAGHVRLSPSRLACRLQYGVYTMVFLNGVFHADPHPGNIFFTEDGRIILLDFGLVGRLNEDEKWALSSFFFACARKEWQLAVDRFIRHFTENTGQIARRRDEFTAEFTEVLRKHFEERRQRWSTLSFVYDGGKTLRRFCASYTTQFTRVAFMLLTGEGMISQIDPQIDIWENARNFTDRLSPYMSDQIKRRFDVEIGGRNPLSTELRKRAASCLVAPTHLDRYFVPSRYPLFIRAAKGSQIEDVDGNRYIDLMCGYGPHILGYSHPVITEAITRACETGIVNAVGHTIEVALAERLVGAFPGSERAVFANSGTEAVIQAIRLCRAYRKRSLVAKFEGHYHGYSDQGLVSSWFRFSGSEDRPRSIAPPGIPEAVTDGTVVLRYGGSDSLALIDELADQLACVICEPMPGILVDYDETFLRRLREQCSRSGVPLIFDEVVSGFRVAFGGVQTRLGIEADLTCLGKIIGGGLPGGAVVGKSELVEMAKSAGDPFKDYENKAFVGGTMSGNSLSCAAGYAMISYLHDRPEIYTDLEEKTDWLLSELRRVGAKYGAPLHIKGKCSIFSVNFIHREPRSVRDQAASYCKANLALAYLVRKHGVFMPELHTMMLSAAHSKCDLETVVRAFDLSLAEMWQEDFFDF